MAAPALNIRIALHCCTIMLTLKWFRENNARLILTESGTALMEEGNQVSVIQIFRFWLRLYKGAIPNINSLVYWISQCARLGHRTSLYESLGWLIRPFYYDSPQNILERGLSAC